MSSRVLVVTIFQAVWLGIVAMLIQLGQLEQAVSYVNKLYAWHFIILLFVTDNLNEKFFRIFGRIGRTVVLLSVMNTFYVFDKLEYMEFDIFMYIAILGGYLFAISVLFSNKIHSSDKCWCMGSLIFFTAGNIFPSYQNRLWHSCSVHHNAVAAPEVR